MSPKNLLIIFENIDNTNLTILTVENNKNKKSVKFQGDMLNFCDFIQVFVFTRNHHLNELHSVMPPFMSKMTLERTFFCKTCFFPS